MTPARLAWWSRALRVKTPIRDASDLRARLVALSFMVFMSVAMIPIAAVLVAFVVTAIHDVGAWASGPSPLEARVHALETQVAAMRDGGRR